MPFNALLLPLLGGYIFITCWNHSRFSSKRYSGERLIFHSAIAGVLFLALAFAITRGLAVWKSGLYDWWRELVPFTYTGTSFLAFFIGATTWWPLNRWMHKHDVEARAAIEGWNDYLEILLDTALREVRQVALTLKGRKIYVGFIVRVFDPAYDRKYVSILPMASGYRESESLNVVFDTDYADTYRQTISTDSPEIVLSGAKRFQIIVPVSEIQSASLFDWDAYAIFQREATPVVDAVPIFPEAMS